MYSQACVRIFWVSTIIEHKLVLCCASTGFQYFLLVCLTKSHVKLKPYAPFQDIKELLTFHVSPYASVPWYPRWWTSLLMTAMHPRTISTRDETTRKKRSARDARDGSILSSRRR